MELIDVLIIAITLIYLVVASLIDLKKNEVPDWLSFSLLFISISFVVLKFFLSGPNWFNVLIAASISYLLFFILANILFHTNTFGGGDYKLMIAISPLLILTSPLIFLLNLIFFASIYGLFWAFFIFLRNIKKFEIRNEIDNRFFTFASICILLLLISLYFYITQRFNFFLYLSLFFFILPFLCLIVRFSDKMLVIEKKPDELSVGDILSENIKLGKKEISAKFVIGHNEILLLKKLKKKVKIKNGIPFVPVFFFSFVFSFLKLNLLAIMVYALL